MRNSTSSRRAPRASCATDHRRRSRRCTRVTASVSGRSCHRRCSSRAGARRACMPSKTRRWCRSRAMIARGARLPGPALCMSSRACTHTHAATRAPFTRAPLPLRFVRVLQQQVLLQLTRAALNDQGGPGRPGLAVWRQDLAQHVSQSSVPGVDAATVERVEADGKDIYSLVDLKGAGKPGGPGSAKTPEPRTQRPEPPVWCPVHR